MLLWFFYAALGVVVIQQFRLTPKLAENLLYSGGTLVVGTAALVWGLQEMSRGGSDPYFPLFLVTVLAYVLHWWRRSKYRVK